MRLLASVLLLSSSAVAFAADDAAIAQKAQTCVACHGPDGVSKTPGIPSLAGQPKQALTTQLVMFREGNRKSPIMAPMAASLSNPDIDGLGTYFSTKTLPDPTTTAAPDVVATGQKLVQEQHCVACHTASLKGQQQMPRLAGQREDYLKAQLDGFHAGTRYDMDGNMTSVAQTLTQEQIDLLSKYLSALK
jgi:cytochrome c553